MKRVHFGNVEVIEEAAGLPEDSVNKTNDIHESSRSNGGFDIAEEEASLLKSNENSGCGVEPFDLESEGKYSGYIDDEGFYIPHEVHEENHSDSELDNESKESSDDESRIRRKRQRKNNAFDEKLTNDSSDSAEEQTGGSNQSSTGKEGKNEEEKRQKLEFVLENLMQNESVRQALRRMGGQQRSRSRSSKKFKQERKENEFSVEKSSKFSEMLEATSSLAIEYALPGIYEWTKTEISGLLSKAGMKSALDVPVEITHDSDSEKPVTWELLWVKDTSNKIHGPFDSQTMNSWYSAGYFDKAKAVVRKKTSQADEEFVDAKKCVPFM